MARTGYITFGKNDRHVADYRLRRCRQALARAISKGAPAKDIEQLRNAEAGFAAEVERVEARRIRV